MTERQGLDPTVVARGYRITENTFQVDPDMGPRLRPSALLTLSTSAGAPTTAEHYVSDGVVEALDLVAAEHARDTASARYRETARHERAVAAQLDRAKAEHAAAVERLTEDHERLAAAEDKARRAQRAVDALAGRPASFTVRHVTIR